MSFAVIQTGGKQYRVKAGEILKIEKLELKKDSNRVEFDNIPVSYTHLTLPTKA